jgi:hypothetical protein
VEVAVTAKSIAGLIWQRQVEEHNKQYTTIKYTHPRLPTPPQHTLTFCVPHAHLLRTTAITFPFSFFLTLFFSNKKNIPMFP